jgi:hypothetical protein
MTAPTERKCLAEWTTPELLEELAAILARLTAKSQHAPAILRRFAGIEKGGGRNRLPFSFPYPTISTSSRLAAQRSLVRRPQPSDGDLHSR